MKATVIHRDTILDFFERLLTLESNSSHHTSTWIICCVTRDELLEQLIIAIAQRQPAAQSNHHASSLSLDRIKSPDLLTPILSRLAVSRNSKLVFVNTISSLRAKLATISTSDRHSPAQNIQMSILNLVSLHTGTSEYSVQGLMRTLAGAVEAAARNKVNLLELCECEDFKRLENPTWGPRLWDAEVPPLNGSVKLREEYSEWANWRLSVRKVAERWFTFEMGPQEHPNSDDEGEKSGGSETHGEDEMLLD